MYKTVRIKVDTWKELHNLRTELSTPNKSYSLDEVIFVCLSVFKIVKILADTYNQNPVDLAKDMTTYYEQYLRRRWYGEKGRGI